MSLINEPPQNAKNRKAIKALLSKLQTETPTEDHLEELQQHTQKNAPLVEEELSNAAKNQPHSETGTHKTWENQSANQVVEPLYYFKPTTMLRSGNEDPTTIVGILQKALRTGNTVKAAGSGHSYSDVATTPDFFIDTHAFNKPSGNGANSIEGQLSQGVLKSGSLQLATDTIHWPNYDPENHRALFETEAGITIKDLNNVLSSRNVGMMNMGGYDGQTIMGAISTSTHGSGITLPPFPDLLRSLVLVTTGEWDTPTVPAQNAHAHGGVYMYRIEPTNGITDPTKYHDDNIGLIQDDDCFNSVICNMGCMGVVYSIVIEVMQMYWLQENRYLSTLDHVMTMLSSPAGQPGAMPTALTNIRNLEVLVHPYPMDEHNKVIEMDPNAAPETYYPHFKCLVTERVIVPRPHRPLGRKGHRNFFTQVASHFGIAFKLIVHILNNHPKLVPHIITQALNGLVDHNYINKYWHIYNLGLNQDAGVATEIGFALEDGNGGYTNENFKAAVDKIHRVAQDARVNGEQYQTSPFSIRFVKSSNAHLSMMQGMNTCMIEMDMITGTYGLPEIMKRYQDNMYALGGRPHWGLEFDNLSGSNNLIADMYPKLDRWMRVYNVFNSQGTFNNKFTSRVGFERHNFVR